MKPITRIPALLLVIIVLPGMAGAQQLQGSDSGRPPAFSVDGPWLLDWRTKSEFPLLSSIEIRLYDADSGDYVGMIAELKGTGSGLKFFEYPGTYQLVIVGTFVDWNITIEEISEERAATLKRRATGETSMLDSAQEATRNVPESSFESWRAEDNETLLLFRDGRLAWRVSFSPPCETLESATALSFVMPADDSDIGSYDSVLLDNGNRCYFTDVVLGSLR
jgi:hypothetical protein